jgi:hypothetical protein
MSSNFKIMFAGETILLTNDLFEEAPLIEALANYKKGPVTIFHSNSREVIMLNHGDDIPSMVSGFIASTHSTSGSAGGGPSRSTYPTSGSAGGGPSRSTYPTGTDRPGPLLASRPSVDIRLDPVTGIVSVFGSPILGGSPTSGSEERSRVSLLSGRSEERSLASLLDGSMSGSNSCSKCGHDFRRCGRKYKMKRNGLLSTDHRECGSYKGSICCNCTVNMGWKKENHWPPSK